VKKRSTISCIILSAALTCFCLSAGGVSFNPLQKHNIKGGVAPVANFSASSTIICAGDSVHFTDLSSNSPTSWSWTFAGGTPSTSTKQNPTVIYNKPGTYAVTLTATNSSGSNTMTEPNYITVSKPTVIVTGNNHICAGNSTTLTASGAKTYVWSPNVGLSCPTCSTTTANPGSTTVYTVVGTDSNNCTNSTTFTVDVTPLPTVAASTTKVICTGITVNLTATGTPSGGTYVWQPGNMPTAYVSVSPQATTVYTVDYTTGCGTAMNTVSVIVTPVPVVVFASNLSAACAPLCTQFFAANTTPAAPIVEWDWSFGDGGTGTGQYPDHCYKEPGQYSVSLSVVSSGGCSSTRQTSNMITVYPLPTASFSYTPSPVNIIYPTVSFNSTSSGKYPIIDWEWNFNDKTDTSSSLSNPTHTYSDTGIYCVSLIVSDTHGCADTATQCIRIGEQYTFYIPNAFSPNGGGLNTVFIPKGTEFANFEMFIFDRWGGQVYYTNDITKGWNGAISNGSQVCQQGLYIYQVNVTDPAGTIHHYTGTVTLLK